MRGGGRMRSGREVRRGEAMADRRPGGEAR